MSSKNAIKAAPQKASHRASGTKLDAGSAFRSENPFAGFQQSLGNQAMLQLFASGALQANLRVSQPGDPDEVEADRVAEKVVAKSHAPIIHRKCACNGGTPCNTCAQERDEESIHRSTALQQLHSPMIQRSADPASAADPAPAVPAKQQPGKAPATLVVEDDSTKVEPYQMRKSQFIALLRTEACAAADAALASVNHTTQGCPYVAKWLSFYEKQSSQHIEDAMHKYAPETVNARNGNEAIRLLVARVQRAAVSWAKTGRVEGIPSGIVNQQSNKKDAKSVIAKLRDFASSGFAGFEFNRRSAEQENSGRSEILRKPSHTEAQSPAHDAASIRSQLGAAHSLDSRVGSQMSSAFGYNFSPVRIHTDSHAAKLCSDLNARAFTIGSDVAFASGEYNPGTLVGDALIAHELAHVVQQGGGNQFAMKAQNSESNDHEFETDANRSASHAVISLWGRSKFAAAGLTARAVPALRSGLRLQSCKCDRSKEVKPTAPLKDVLPAFNCEPTPASLDDVKKVAGLRRGILGITRAVKPNLQPKIHPSYDGSCTLEIPSTPPFALDKFLYTKPGKYDIGETAPAPGKCKGKVVPEQLTVTPALSEKIKAAEMEHCEDMRRAYMLSLGRYVQVFEELSHSYCAEGSDCDTETNKRFKERTGVEYKDIVKVTSCLLDKTGIRDDRGWHTVDLNNGPHKVAPDCSAIIYTPDASKAFPEVGGGKHKPEDLVKGCGE